MQKIELKIDGENSHHQSWMDSIKRNKYGKNYIELEVLNYTDLGNKITSLLTVCRIALENNDINNYNAELDICNVLDIASKLIPLAELELLDKMAVNPES